jgi:hypothetical protein
MSSTTKTTTHSTQTIQPPPVPPAPVIPPAPVVAVAAPVPAPAPVVAVQVPVPVPVAENILLTRLAELYDYSKSILDTKKITTTNIIMIMNNLIQVVEKYKELTGNQKKMLVLDTLKKIINENVSDESEKQQLILFVNITLPIILDSIISAINGNMKFAKEKISGCFSKLFSCC